ncbi:hypothetical protein ACO2Q0_03065 [Phenylobacterium sp. VNQ135]|uniref:hypothetical protein n=1 Tax=Phenylobacterium sp. VNQ135 TaxID=3400922 RepID=UPI003BFD1D86
MTSKQREERAKMVADGTFEAQRSFVKDQLLNKLPKEAPRITRSVAKGAVGAPGIVYNGAQLFAAEDKGRALAGLIGGGLVGMAGGAAGGPIGAGVGSVAGQEAAEYLYDEYADDVERALRSGAGAAKDWVKVRQRRIAETAARAAAPYWRGDDYYRALGR